MAQFLGVLALRRIKKHFDSPRDGTSGVPSNLQSVGHGIGGWMPAAPFGAEPTSLVYHFLVAVGRRIQVVEAKAFG